MYGGQKTEYKRIVSAVVGCNISFSCCGWSAWHLRFNAALEKNEKSLALSTNITIDANMSNEIQLGFICAQVKAMSCTKHHHLHIYICCHSLGFAMPWPPNTRCDPFQPPQSEYPGYATVSYDRAKPVWATQKINTIAAANYKSFANVIVYGPLKHNRKMTCLVTSSLSSQS